MPETQWHMCSAFNRSNMRYSSSRWYGMSRFQPFVCYTKPKLAFLKYRTAKKQSYQALLLSNYLAYYRRISQIYKNLRTYSLWLRNDFWYQTRCVCTLDKRTKYLSMWKGNSERLRKRTDDNFACFAVLLCLTSSIVNSVWALGFPGFAASGFYTKYGPGPFEPSWLHLSANFNPTPYGTSSSSARTMSDFTTAGPSASNWSHSQRASRLHLLTTTRPGYTTSAWRCVESMTEQPSILRTKWRWAYPRWRRTKGHTTADKEFLYQATNPDDRSDQRREQSATAEISPPDKPTTSPISTKCQS